ncbi:MAG: helix-turn-helix domain-containing protein, partial [Pseudomonadota bacterium]
MSIVLHRSWTGRRKLTTLAQRSKDAYVRRRACAISALLTGRTVSEVAQLFAAARSTLYRWMRWFAQQRLSGLVRQRGGREVRTVTERLLRALNTLVMQSPQRYGYLRASWTSELLAEALNAHYRLVIHPSTVRRVLNR